MEPIATTNAIVSTPTSTNTMVEVASDDDEHDNGLLVFTANEILMIRLKLVLDYKKRRIRRAKKQTNLDRFRGHFGSNPNVLAEILEDLQMTEVEGRVFRGST